MKRAFTLIELLVVIAIIAILAAILFPVFTQAKLAAKKTQAMSNMKQLGTSLEIYLSNSDDAFAMCANYGTPTTDPNRVWTNAVMPYVKNTGIFVLPTGGNAKFSDSWANRGWQNLGMNTATSYDPAGCVNGDLTNPNCEGFTSVVTSTSLEEPANSGMFATTPGGDTALRYRGFSFSPMNGSSFPLPTLADARPLVSDKDLFLDPAYSSWSPGQMKPVWCAFSGTTPVVFGDTHAKSLQVGHIKAKGVIWRFR